MLFAAATGPWAQIPSGGRSILSTEQEAGGVLAALSQELADAVERIGRSVVSVESRRRVPGSGVVWPEAGVIVTADHVLERQEDITVLLGSGDRVSATLAGRD